MIYLDHAATTPVPRPVADAMYQVLTEQFGNPSSQYPLGREAKALVEDGRAVVAGALGCRPENLHFTSCGTESDNWAIRAAAWQGRHTGRHIITTAVEHPAILQTCAFWERQGYRVTRLGVDNKGRLNLDEYRDALDDDTAIVSIMWANNEVGNIYPIKKMAEMARERGILFHTDAVQAAGKIPLDLADVPVDMLSISGHKLHAPKGIGLLFVRKGVLFRPFMRGGHQEKGRRAGTENVPYIVGLGVACQMAKDSMHDELTRVAALRDRLEKGIVSQIPDTLVNGDTENRVPNTTNISFRNIEGEAILLMLNQYNICASSGSACTSGSLEPSHVLHAMGVPFKYAHSSTRLSLSRYNTQEEVDFAISKFPEIIATLRKLSPFKD